MHSISSQIDDEKTARRFSRTRRKFVINHLVDFFERLQSVIKVGAIFYLNFNTCTGTFGAPVWNTMSHAFLEARTIYGVQCMKGYFFWLPTCEKYICGILFTVHEPATDTFQRALFPLTFNTQAKACPHCTVVVHSKLWLCYEIQERWKDYEKACDEGPMSTTKVKWKWFRPKNWLRWVALKDHGLCVSLGTQRRLEILLHSLRQLDWKVGEPHDCLVSQVLCLKAE